MVAPYLLRINNNLHMEWVLCLQEWIIGFGNTNGFGNTHLRKILDRVFIYVTDKAKII